MHPFTHPDIAYAVSKLGQHISDPSEVDFTKAKRVLRYLKGTQDFKISYNRNGNREFFGYTDSDWAGDYENRKSTSGYVFLLAGVGQARSKRQLHFQALKQNMLLLPMQLKKLFLFVEYFRN